MRASTNSATKASVGTLPHVVELINIVVMNHKYPQNTNQSPLPWGGAPLLNLQKRFIPINLRFHLLNQYCFIC